ncbi:MAG: hypothetical protein K6G52_02345 [Treponemataceae bacterium]|nr:hypothetical protein [Treponemataceae bacterium]
MKTKRFSSFIKKAVLFLTLLMISTTAVFADQDDKDSKKKNKDKDNERTFFDRFWELGVSADVGIANNYFEVLDFFHETIVVDFTDMYSTINYKGLTLDLGVGVHVFSNVLAKKFNIGFDVGVDPVINMAISKDVIGLIAEGNSSTLDQAMTVGAGVAAAAYLDLDVPFGFDLGEKIKLHVTPSYYIPLVYLPYTDVTATVQINSDGTASVSMDKTLAVYSALPIYNYINGDTTLDYLDILSKGGFDITVAGELEFLEVLDLGASATNIPIVPSHLQSQYAYRVQVNYTMETSLLAQLMSGSFNSSSFADCYSFEPVESDGSTINVFRPLKFGFWANWRVLGTEMLVLTPFVQMRFLDGTVANAVGFGFDYALKALLDLKFFRTSLTTSYVDNIFKQELALAFNLRFFELDLVIASEATTFAKSFCGSGVGVGVGVILGF